MIPLVGAFGVFLAVRGERRLGGALAIAAGSVFVLVVRVVIPWFNGSGWGYGGPFAEFFRRPWMAPMLIVTPAEKIRTILSWLSPFLFLPLGSPWGLLVVPVALERLLSSAPAHWIASGHYSAPLAPLLAMSAGDALRRLALRIRDPLARNRLVTGLAASCMVVAAIVPGHQPLWQLFRPRTYQPIETEAAGRRALHVVPPDASVVALPAVATHHDHRDRLHILDDQAPDADYVITSSNLNGWPMTRRNKPDCWTTAGSGAIGWSSTRTAGSS
jgi:hypothetical protein